MSVRATSAGLASALFLLLQDEDDLQLRVFIAACQRGGCDRMHATIEFTAAHLWTGAWQNGNAVSLHRRDSLITCT